jgi:2-keto-4-pentenoate hydratase/2-oxohepta-3-ene-1,7-dioic acid hydratase in catechol pathway
MSSGSPSDRPDDQSGAGPGDTAQPRAMTATPPGTRFVRCVVDGSPTWGVVDGVEIAIIEPHPFVPYAPTGRRVPLEGLRLLAPVIPSKIIGVGRNYRDHAAELGNDVPTELLLFLMPSTALLGPGDPVPLPVDLSDDIQFEGEVAVVIGALLSRVTKEVAAAAILGVTCSNDLTMRDVQRREGQWFRGKGFDGSCPLGPAITTGLDLGALRVRTWVDGELRQDGTTADMVFDIPTIIAEISQTVTLLPGDVVLTGTPAGVGRVLPGQRVRVEVEGVGVLENLMVARPT